MPEVLPEEMERIVTITGPIERFPAPVEKVEAGIQALESEFGSRKAFVPGGDEPHLKVIFGVLDPPRMEP